MLGKLAEVWFCGGRPDDGVCGAMMTLRKVQGPKQPRRVRAQRTQGGWVSTANQVQPRYSDLIPTQCLQKLKQPSYDGALGHAY